MRGGGGHMTSVNIATKGGRNNNQPRNGGRGGRGGFVRGGKGGRGGGRSPGFLPEVFCQLC
jgi:hypothetical protein